MEILNIGKFKVIKTVIGYKKDGKPIHLATYRTDENIEQLKAHHAKNLQNLKQIEQEQIEVCKEAIESDVDNEAKERFKRQLEFLCTE